MTVGTTSLNIKKFCRSHCEFQRTFATPLKDLDLFVTAILSGDDVFEKGTLEIDQVVFEPKNLLGVLTRHSLPTACVKGASLVALGREEINDLLRAALSSSVDFLFIPQPKAFLIYADHDGYTTFFGSKKSHSSRVAEHLLLKGFKEISGYQRTF